MRAAVVAVVLGVIALTGCAGAQRHDLVSYIDEDGAQLQGRLFSSRTEIGKYWFEWGRTTALGKRTPDFAVDFVAGELQTVLYDLNQLQPATTYHWRVCADDSDPDHPDPGCSDIGSFPTSPVPAGSALVIGDWWRPFNNERDRSLNSEGPFTLEGPAVITIQDAYCPGDRYRLIDNGVVIGTTNRVVDDGTCTPYVPFLERVIGDPAFSHGSFTLGEGPHSLRTRVLAGVNNIYGGDGFIRADPVQP
jgi:hypothetical protein